MRLDEIRALPDSIPFERLQQLAADLLGSVDALRHVKTLTLHLNSIEVTLSASNEDGLHYVTEDNEVAVHKIQIPVSRD